MNLPGALKLRSDLSGYLFILRFNPDLVKDFIEEVDSNIASDFLVEVITILQGHSVYHQNGIDEMPMAASESAGLLLSLAEELNYSITPDINHDDCPEMADEFYDGIYELLDRFTTEGEMTEGTQEACIAMGDITHREFTWKAYPEQGVINVRF